MEAIGIVLVETLFQVLALVAGCGFDLLAKLGRDTIPALAVKVGQVVLDLPAP
jgi:hypothetical protein